MKTVWGIHMGKQVGTHPYDEGYVAIGWSELGDIRKYPDREAFKTALGNLPGMRLGAIPVYAGVLNRFTHEMAPGDIVVYPSKIDRQICIGEITGTTNYVPNPDDEYPNRRSVKWLGRYPRTAFSQSALNEVGAFITLFLIKMHAAEFLSKVDSNATNVISSDEEEINPDDDAAVAALATHTEETTHDFIIKKIMTNFDGYEFEEFAANILQCMNYQARVTPKSGDGGVDVIAHEDPLGFRPPIIKVQCKRSEQQFGEREVSQLKGTLGEGEFGLFITLGTFSRQARVLERNSPKIRLIDGEEFSQIVIANYKKLAPRFRSVIPLKEIYVPDVGGGKE